MTRAVGMMRVRRAFLGKIAVLYVIVTALALALPVIATKPRGSLPHPSQQEPRSHAPGGAAPVAARR
jgi:hypothetical protein